MTRAGEPVARQGAPGTACGTARGTARSAGAVPFLLGHDAVSHLLARVLDATREDGLLRARERRHQAFACQGRGPRDRVASPYDIRRHLKRLTYAAGDEVASELGVSRITVHHLVRPFRAGGTVRFLMPRSRGRRQGIVIDDETGEPRLGSRAGGSGSRSP